MEFDWSIGLTTPASTSAPAPYLKDSYNWNNSILTTEVPVSTNYLFEKYRYIDTDYLDSIEDRLLGKSAEPVKAKTGSNAAAVPSTSTNTNDGQAKQQQQKKPQQLSCCHGKNKYVCKMCNWQKCCATHGHLRCNKCAPDAPRRTEPFPAETITNRISSAHNFNSNDEQSASQASALNILMMNKNSQTTQLNQSTSSASSATQTFKVLTPLALKYGQKGRTKRTPSGSIVSAAIIEDGDDTNDTHNFETQSNMSCVSNVSSITNGTMDENRSTISTAINKTILVHDDYGIAIQSRQHTEYASEYELNILCVSNEMPVVTLDFLPEKQMYRVLVKVKEDCENENKK